MSIKTKGVWGVMIIIGLISLLVFLYFSYLYSQSIPDNDQNVETYTSKPEHISCIKTGDIICREGNSVWSDLFHHLSKRDQRFCHVGIIINEKGKLTVVHAEANDFTGIGEVFEQPLSDFLQEGNGAVVYRLTEPLLCPEAKIKESIRRRIKTPFDFKFDLRTSDKLYCTEYVFYVLQEIAPHIQLIQTEIKNKKFIPVDSCNDPQFFHEVIKFLPNDK